MARPEVTGRKPPNRKRPKTPQAWYSRASFCIAHHISESFYHQLKNAGRGPRETTIGARIFITFDDAAAWRDEQARTASTAAE